MQKFEEEIEITESNLRKILGEEYPKFERYVIKKVYCTHCHSSYNSTITEFRVYINDLNDVILKGFCKDCGHPVGRYAETGEDPKHSRTIERIRKLFKN